MTKKRVLLQTFENLKARAIKHILLAVVIIICFNCESIQTKPKNEFNLKDRIKQGKSILITDKEFNSPIDFTEITEQILINENILQVNIRVPVTFKNCVFKKPVIAYKKVSSNEVILSAFWGNLSFIDCVFEDQVNFRETIVYGITNFTKSHFNSFANFEGVSFNQNTYFTNAIFEKETRFQNSFFSKKSNFLNTTYLDKTSFQNGTFNGELQFSNSTFNAYADFSLVDCKDNVFFNYAIFESTADFNNSNFYQNFNFIKTQNKMTTFNHSKFLGNTKFYDSEGAYKNFKSCFFLFKN